MLSKRTIKIILFTMGYGAFSLFMFFLTKDGLSVWLGINVGFAIIPLLLIIGIEDILKQRAYRITFIIVLLTFVYIFFLPNTFYIITDFIHLDSSMFYYREFPETMYGISNNVYLTDVSPYLLLFHITSAAVVGIYAGVESLRITERLTSHWIKNKNLVSLVIIGLVFLSSIGIYIGRFLRLFSWDILNPFNIIQQLFQRFDMFMVIFILSFTIIQYALFIVYKHIKQS